MKILAFDTSNQPLVVTLAQDSKIVQQYETNVARNHSIQLLPAIRHVLDEEGWQLTDIDRIIVAQGPGSFTGLRIGITVAKVLADTLSIPLVGVSSLALLAEKITESELVVPMFDARNENVFAGVYRHGQNILADGHYPLQTVLDFLKDQTGSLTLMGDAEHFSETIEAVLAPRALTVLPVSDSFPNGQGIVKLGLQGIPVADLANFNPHYLRKTQAELNWLAQHPGEDQPESYVFEV